MTLPLILLTPSSNRVTFINVLEIGPHCNVNIKVSDLENIDEEKSKSSIYQSLCDNVYACFIILNDYNGNFIN